MKTTTTLALSALALAGCAQTTPTGGSATQSGAAAAPSATATPSGDEVGGSDAVTREAAGPSPRLAVSYDGGVLVLGAMDLEVLADLPVEGFTRLSPAGDGRHLFVTEGDSLRLLDAGTWSEPHGNHDHSYTTTPVLTDLRVEGSHPGHVVPHAGTTALYFDGDGRVDLLDPTTLDPTADAIEIARSHEVAEAHHGVALVLSDGSLLETVGTQEERTGVHVLAPDGTETAVTDECPGVHGEAVAADEVVVLGCSDGLVVYRDGEFTKVSSPDPNGAIGTQAGTESSPIMLGDYKVREGDEVAAPEQVSLVDTTSGELRLVDLGTSYTFRSLARGPQGEALVLGTDGHLHVIDPDSGELTHDVPVVDAWDAPEDWQQPRPTIFVLGQFGYVTEPATSEVHVIDLDAMKVIDSALLPEVPNELTGVDGRVPATGRGHDAHDDHQDHEGHDH